MADLEEPSHWLAISAAFAVVSFCTLLIVGFLGDRRKMPWFVTITVILSWILGISVVVLLPVDLASVNIIFGLYNPILDVVSPVLRRKCLFSSRSVALSYRRYPLDVLAKCILDVISSDMVTSL